MENAVQSFYGNRLRLRVCGLCIHEEKLLLINHQGLSKTNFWSPPGGGLVFGETAETCLKREFKEETNLEVEVKQFLFACEFIKPPLHAVELFFEVKPVTAQLKTGTDPEAGSPSIIKEAKFLSWNEIQNLSFEELHGVFKLIDNASKVSSLRGYFRV